MKRIVHHLPDLAWEQAALITQLTTQSLFAPEDIADLQLLLARHSPARLLEALDQVMDALAAEGRLPTFPFGPEADSYSLLYTGICRLHELAEPTPATYLAAA
jgi:hypothetical protein